MDRDEIVGSLLFQARMSANYTIDEAASRIGMTAHDLVAIEAGHSKVLFGDVLRLLDVYDVSLARFTNAFALFTGAQIEPRRLHG